MTDRGRAGALHRALRAFGLIILPFNVGWAAIGIVIGAPSVAGVGVIATLFAVWLLLQARGSKDISEAELATRIAVGTQVTAAGAVLAEPVIGTGIALGSLIPVIVALPYVQRATLMKLMAISAAVGAVAMLAPAVLPWGSRFDWVAAILPTTTLVFVYVTFQLFLWNASSRVTSTTAELRHVIEMSHDLASTLDPREIGHRLARHIALVSKADDCVLSTWDREGDRVVTFGCYPIERLVDFAEAYELAKFPATREVLRTHETVIVWFRTLGCNFGQGYHYARPMPPADVDRYLQHGAASWAGSRATVRARRPVAPARFPATAS